MYELLYIISTKFTETEIEPIIQRAEESIKKIGGEIISKENMGKKKLAYPIDHTFRGYYIFNVFKLENTQNLKDLDKDLKLNTAILRYLITKNEPEKEKPAKPKEIKTEIKKKKITSEELDKKLEEILEV